MAEIGRLIAVGLGPEDPAARGTAVSPTYWIPRTDYSFADAPEFAMDTSSLGRIESQADAFLINQFGEGSIAGPIRDKDFGLILLAAFGAVSAPTLASGEAAAWEHTFTVENTNIHDAMTITRVGTAETRAYPLAMLSSLEVGLTLDDLIGFSSDWISQKGETATESAAYVAENIFAPQHATVKFADTVAGLAGVTQTKVQSFSFTIEKNTNPYRVLGNVTPEEIYNHQFAVTGDFGLIFDSVTYRDWVTTVDKKACSISIKNTDVTIGSAENPEVFFEFGDLVFTDWTPAFGNDDLVTQVLACAANYSISETEMIRAILTNTVSSSYAHA